MSKILVLLFFFTCSLFAQESAPQMSLSTYESIQEVQKLMQTSQNEKIKAILRELEEDDLEVADKAYTFLYFGYFYMKTEEYDKAINYYEKTLALHVLLKAQHVSILNSLYQMYMIKEKYTLAIRSIDKLLVLDEKSEKYYIKRSQANLALENFSETINDINHALHVSTNPKERYYKVLYYCHVERKEYDGAIKSVESLLAMNPTKKEYWIYLSTLHSILKKYDKAFEDLQLAYSAEVIESEELYLRLVHSLRYYKMPYESAQLLEEKILDKNITKSEENLELLADTFYEAKETSQALVYYIKASHLSKESKISYKIAQIYAQEREYEKVVIFALEAIEKKSELDAWVYILLGSAYVELNQKDEALESFKKALTYKKTLNDASQWIIYLKSKDS